MKLAFLNITTLCALSLFALPAVQADYRAEAVQSATNGQSMVAHLAVGKNAMRTEHQRHGESVVQIINLSNGQQTLLFPANKTYMQSPAGGPIPQGKRTSPCEGWPGAQCVEQGRENIGGRAAVKWQVTTSAQGRSLSGTQWMDVERGLPLRILGPNGEQTEMRMLGKESLQGKKKKKWEISTRLPNGQSYTGRQWYDPVLDTLLREELPDGSTRELKKIEIGDLPADAFTVPQGFTRVEPPSTTR